MLTTERAKWAFHLVIPFFLLVISICILAVKIPDSKFVKESLESIENNKVTVLEFSGATLATSVAISALPDDFASPLADTLAGMTKYYVFIFAVLFIEKLLATEGIKVAFLYLIPAACVIYMIAVLINKKVVRDFALKLAIFGLAFAMAVPISTHVTEVVCADYMAYVDETIEETNQGSNKINEVISAGDTGKSLFEKLSDICSNAINGVKDLLAYFNNMIKKCVNSIAILIVTTFVMPIITLLFLKWLLQELFKIGFDTKFLKEGFLKKNGTVFLGKKEESEGDK